MTSMTDPTKSDRRLHDYRDLVANLVYRDIRIRYMDAALGFGWALLNPAIMILTYLVVFTFIFRAGPANYSLYLITGMIHWMFFVQVVLQGPELLVTNAGLLKKIYFPRLLVPIANLLVNFVLWLTAFAMFLVLFPFLGGKFTVNLVYYPLFLLLFLAFTFGISLILSTLYVRFRDIKHIVEVLIQVLFWSTPIVYDINMVPEPFRDYQLFNPLAEFVLVFEHFFYYGNLPPGGLLLWFLGWTIVVAGCGVWLFQRLVPTLIEEI